MNAPVSYDPHSEAWTTPLDQLDPGDPARFQADTMWPYFARLRRDAPVHYSTTSPMFGPYWSVTKYKDIMAVEVNHKAFSSDSGFGGISIRDRPKELQLPMFIAMDPPRHDDQRKVVQPIVAPANLAKLEGIIRDRVCTILDGLPRGETFNWVEHVSIELIEWRGPGLGVRIVADGGVHGVLSLSVGLRAAGRPCRPAPRSW